MATGGANEKLGLPRQENGMKKIAIAFDVDGTLVAEGDKPIAETLMLLSDFLIQPWKNVDIIVWSGGGAEYARTMVEKRLPTGDVNKVKFYSKLDHLTIMKRYHFVIAIDDIQDTALGDANLIVRNK